MCALVCTSSVHIQVRGLGARSQHPPFSVSHHLDMFCLFVSLRQNLSLNLEHTFHQTCLTNEFPLGPTCLCHHSAGISGVCHPVGFLRGCLGTELRFVCVPSEPSSSAFPTQCSLLGLMMTSCTFYSQNYRTESKFSVQAESEPTSP